MWLAIESEHINLYFLTCHDTLGDGEKQPRFAVLLSGCQYAHVPQETAAQKLMTFGFFSLLVVPLYTCVLTISHVMRAQNAHAYIRTALI